jgi:hypothetical protein
MRSTRRFFSTVTAMIVMGTGLILGAPGTAQAAASDCTGGANGFTDIPDSLSGRAVGGGGGLVASDSRGNSIGSYGMQAGYVNGREMGWGYLQTSGSWIYETVGYVWMDVTNNGGSSWIQCGPFQTFEHNKRLTTAAYPTSSSSSRAFRVCAEVKLVASHGTSGIQCTPWW